MGVSGFRMVAAYRDLIQAETAAELLRSAGIEALVLDGFTTGVQPLYAYALGGVKVLVREPDVERSRALLRALLINLQYTIPSARRAGSGPGAARCRACGSLDTVSAPGAARLGWVALWGFGLPLPVFGPRRRCLSCGHVGRPAPEGRFGPEAPLPPAFARAIAEYESGLRRRLVVALKRVRAHKARAEEAAAAKTEAARRRHRLDVRYEAVREDAVAAVAARLASQAERGFLAAQAELSWSEVLDLLERTGALTGPARAVLARLAAEARRRADLPG